ncbi:GntR family transcriptional regulator [Enemella sp. A6]|uniref:GntR family transcriptional regulator n=1 Tax=Enemella sp. A6 TaxID=3440152 RepID=UPI003EB9C71F
MSRRPTLVARISEELRSELAAGLHRPGARLPTETELSQRFGVSRPTVRNAIRELEALGLVTTRHGAGTFVNSTQIEAGLEKLDSITESIRATGKTPGMLYADRVRRPVLPDEASHMGVPGDTEVVELRRMILADGVVVAYSYDLLPARLLPPDLDLNTLDGSIFGFLRNTLGIHPSHASAEVHAIHSEHIGWGPEAAAHRLFVLLNQLHYDADDQVLLYSRTYFIEGRYSFTIRRRS